MSSSPAVASDPADPGDEVQRRFRYQINYCALKALQLLDSATAIQAVYCEQIEDLLIELPGNKFIGVQIKTRELNQAPYRASDAVIISTLSRFCSRNQRFPGYFVSFILATNFVFYEGDGGDDLRKVLECARTNPTFNGLGPRNTIRKFFSDFVKSTGHSVSDVVATLSKVQLEERRTGIDQPDLELIPALGEIDAYCSIGYLDLMRAARMLRNHVWDSSSLALEGSVFGTHGLNSDGFDAHVAKLRAARKRIDAGTVRALLDQAIASDDDGETELLTIREYITRQHIPPGLGRMQLKLAAGAVNYDEIEQMKDDVASLEATFARWKERFGLDEANRRLAHLQHFALRDARQAKSQVRGVGEPYGRAMLEELQHQVDQTCTEERSTLFNCRKEHLLGAAGLLTEECKVWWSEQIDLGVTSTTDRNGEADHGNLP